MHTRSKRYLRRHRARLRAQLRTSVKPLQREDRLAQQIAVGMQKRWPEITRYSRAHDPSSNRTLP
jgi:hypothetical protein